MQIENQLKIKIMKPNCYKQSKNLSCLYTNGGSIKRVEYQRHVKRISVKFIQTKRSLGRLPYSSLIQPV